jgi:hypothetical protein
VSSVRSPGDLPVHSFASLLTDLATICLTRSSPPTPPCPASGSSPPPPRSSAKPSTCSASATASGSRSQQHAPAIPKSQVNSHPRESPGGTSGWRETLVSLRSPVGVAVAGCQACVGDAGREDTELARALTDFRCKRVHQPVALRSYMASTFGMISSFSRLRSSSVFETGTSANGGQMSNSVSPASFSRLRLSVICAAVPTSRLVAFPRGV